ncbi:MAG: GntR family transcriptional regulator [Chloroflexota bacterium]
MATTLLDNWGDRKETLSRFEYACERLRLEIVGGIYAPRQRLIETEVAEALGVSRTTLRTVFIRLKQEGLLETEANRGVRVRTFTVEEALRILEAREVLEGLAARRAADRATDGDLRALGDITDDMAAMAAAGELLRYSALNGRFHAAVIQMAENPEVERLLKSLHYALIRYQFRTTLVPGRKDASLAEHRHILECIKQRNGQAAEQAMRGHVAAVRQTLEGSAALLSY